MTNERELKQLWYTAEHYWEAATAVYNSDTNGKLKCADVAKSFATQKHPSNEIKSINFLLADISSAAIRLVTIDERFFEDCGRRIMPRYLDALNKSKKADILVSHLRNGLNTWIHQLLRDNAAHLENSQTGAVSIFNARQKTIESLTVTEVVRAMEKVIEVYKEELKTAKII
jgi:hypothetical protein